jgi:hypothetical protein
MDERSRSRTANGFGRAPQLGRDPECRTNITSYFHLISRISISTYPEKLEMRYLICKGLDTNPGSQNTSSWIYVPTKPTYFLCLLVFTRSCLDPWPAYMLKYLHQTVFPPIRSDSTVAHQRSRPAGTTRHTHDGFISDTDFRFSMFNSRIFSHLISMAPLSISLSKEKVPQ